MSSIRPPEGEVGGRKGGEGEGREREREREEKSGRMIVLGGYAKEKTLHTCTQFSLNEELSISMSGL